MALSLCKWYARGLMVYRLHRRIQFLDEGAQLRSLTPFWCCVGLLMQKEMELTNLRGKVAELMAFMPSVTLAGFGRAGSGGGSAVGSTALRYSPTYTAVQQDSSVVSPDYTSSMSQ